jgi:hypothetical protein
MLLICFVDFCMVWCKAVLDVFLQLFMVGVSVKLSVLILGCNMCFVLLSDVHYLWSFKCWGKCVSVFVDHLHVIFADLLYVAFCRIDYPESLLLFVIACICSLYPVENAMLCMLCRQHLIWHVPLLLYLSVRRCCLTMFYVVSHSECCFHLGVLE